MGHFMPNEQIFFQNYIRHMFCILMKFGTVVDLNEKPETQKNFRKTLIIYGVMII